MTRTISMQVTIEQVCLHRKAVIPLEKSWDVGIWSNAGLTEKIYATDLSKAFSTVSLVGKAGIAPLSFTVRAPQALANLSASLSRSSFCEELISSWWLLLSLHACFKNK